MKYVGLIIEYIKMLWHFAKAPVILALLLFWVAYVPYIMIRELGFFSWLVSIIYGGTLVAALDALAKEIQNINGKPKV